MDRPRRDSWDGTRIPRQLRTCGHGLAAASVLLMLAAALASCKPAATSSPQDHGLPTSTEQDAPAATATVEAGLGAGLDFEVGADWPAISVETSASVSLLYTHSPPGLIEVLGDPGWDHMALITGDLAAIVDVRGLNAVRVIEIGSLGALEASAMDGQRLALAFRGGGVHVYAVPGGSQQAAYETEIMQLAFSPDGEMLAGAGADFVLYVWDLLDGDILYQFPLEGMPGALAFSPDSRTLAVELQGGMFQGVQLWDLDGGEGARIEWTESAAPLYYVRFSPDWTLSAWASREYVMLIDLADGSERGLLQHDDYVDETEFSPDSAILVTTAAAQIEGDLTGAVHLWDAASGEPISTLVNGDAAVLVAFSPDGRLLASTTYEGRLRLWDLASGELLAELGGDQTQVFRLFFANGSRMLVSAGWEGEVHFWAVRRGGE